MHSVSLGIDGISERLARWSGGASIHLWLDVAALVAWSAAGVTVSQLLGPTTASGNIAAVVGIVGALGLVLGIRRLRGEPWATLGLARRQGWGRAIGWSLLATVVIAVLAGAAETLVIRPLLGGAAADTSRFAALTGNPALFVGTLASVWVTAALAEEVVYRGFLMGRLATLLGGGRVAWLASLVLSSVLFGALHLYQGAVGVAMTGFTGLLLGAVYLITGRDLRVCILTHGLVNTVSLTFLYLGMG